MKRKPDRELKRLFGDTVVMLAGITDPAKLDLTAALMDRVHDGADALLARSGNLDAQHRYINGMPFKVRLVLCMWLMDIHLATKLVRVVYARA